MRITRSITLTQLIKPEVLQQIQDALSDFTGMAAITTDADGVPITKGSNFLNFCTNIIRGTEKGLHLCHKCDRMGAERTMKSGCPEVYQCHAGLVDFAAPIIVDGQMIGSFVGGQSLIGELDEDLCRRKAAEYGIDPELYITEAKKATRITKDQVERAAKLIVDISKAISSFALQSYEEIEKSHSLEMNARSQADYIIDVITEIFNSASGYVGAAKDAVGSGDPEKMRAVLELISNEGSGTAGMISDSLTYLNAIGNKFRMDEEEYDPRLAMTSVVDNILRKLEKDGVSIALELSENIPGRLLGDAGSMCQLVDKFISLSAELGGRSMVMTVDSEKHCYASRLIIRIITDKLDMTEQQLETVDFQMNNKDEFSTSSAFQEYGLPLARLLLHSMSGRFRLKRTDSGAEFVMTIPQLEVKGGNG
ncbi:MAG: PocR ligand-binding domain-containing protein [Oscillospiraceae bacterium]